MCSALLCRCQEGPVVPYLRFGTDWIPREYTFDAERRFPEVHTGALCISGSRPGGRASLIEIEAPGAGARNRKLGNCVFKDEHLRRTPIL